MINNEDNKVVKKEELEKRKRKKPEWLTRRVRTNGNCFLSIFLCTCT